MLNVSKLSISFQGEPLLEDISFRLGQGDRVGLIGKNGAGKSTLLRILSGEQEYDSGQIATEQNLSIGFLKQDLDLDHSRSILDETLQAFIRIKQLEADLETTNEQLASRTDYESNSYNDLMIRLNELQHDYEREGGFTYKGEAEKVLFGLGFERHRFESSCETLSGGWRMRIELAKLLLQNHDILLLDEPTNHLDIESIIWLEAFLKSYPGAVVIVSHDKMFLDQVTNRTIEISLGRIYDFKKPYSAFITYRDEIRQQQLAAQKNQEKQIAHTEKLIEKFRAKATKASMAQSLIKKLDKIERIAVDAVETQQMKLNFPVSVQPGKVVFEMKEIGKSFGQLKVIQGVNMSLERGAKIAFVGQNGQGKSTLAKIIVGELEHEGEVKMGHNVQIGYFAQNQIDYLDGDKTVLDTMIDAANESNRTKVRDILGAFLFSGEEVEKYVKVLSGGERNRLALAKLLLQPLNVLVMDEPTNHLDITSKQVLNAALQRFEGTLILVSHDRDFLHGLAERIYEFRDGKVKTYLGDIDYFLEQRQLEHLRQAEAKTVEKSVKENSSGKQAYEAQKKHKALKNKISKLESQIGDLEKELREMDTKLELNYDETAADPNFFDSYQQLKERLNERMHEWEHLLEELEKQSK